MASAWADGTTVTFRVPDPGHRLAGVRLSQDVRIPGGQPPVTRMGYLLELRYPDGGAETVTDPGNPRQVGGHDPAAFAGLFLQSGSFFCPRFDGHESWFGCYPRITAFVGGFHRAGQPGGDLPGRPVPTVLTCGAIEETLPNNRLVCG